MIRLEGVVTMRTVCALRARMRDIFVRQMTGPIVVDCSAVGEADSAALALFLDWQRAADGRLVIQQPSPGLISLAELYDLDDVLPFVIRAE